MHVPFNDLSLIHNKVKKKINISINSTIKKNSFILSKQVDLFEKEFSRYCCAKYSIGCGNGYDALFLAIKSLNLKRGTEVIIPAMTYAATAYAAINADLKLILVDVDKQGLLDMEKLEKKLNSRTGLVIPVHLYGQSVNMKRLRLLKKKYNFKIIEDCAQAHGALDLSTNRKIGCIGDIACYSFYPGKNLGAFGDAGAIVTNNKSIYNKIKTYRALGSKRKYIHSNYGVNSRLDEIQAGILRIKLKQLDKWNMLRREIGHYYLKNIKFNNKFIAINTTPGSVYHIFNILVPNRNKFMKFLRINKIEFVIHYPKSINQHIRLKNTFRGIKFKNSEKIASNSISLPLFPYMKKNQIGYVVDKVNEFILNN